MNIIITTQTKNLTVDKSHLPLQVAPKDRNPFLFSLKCAIVLSVGPFLLRYPPCCKWRAEWIMNAMWILCSKEIQIKSYPTDRQLKLIDSQPIGFESNKLVRIYQKYQYSGTHIGHSSFCDHPCKYKEVFVKNGKAPTAPPFEWVLNILYMLMFWKSQLLAKLLVANLAKTVKMYTQNLGIPFLTY